MDYHSVKVAIKFNLKSMRVLWVLLWTVLGYIPLVHGQGDQVEVGETMKEYIKEHHVQKIENVVHKFCSSKLFLQALLEKGHNIDPATVSIQRKDVTVGKDIDVYVKHFTEHQNFTMILVPISFYNLAIYDTLLFSVLEVSDNWLSAKFQYDDLSDQKVKQDLLSLENHDLLSEHMYHQALQSSRTEIAEVKVSLHETYISTNTIHLHTGALSKEEKHEFKKSWGLFKKLFSHNVTLNIELNVYIFGYDDMEVLVEGKRGKELYKVTPGNIFTRHHFLEE